MWHEARKQERLIRGMIVDYRRRAERRKDFYEKIKAEPTQFLQLHGRRCKIHLDPAVAAAGDGPAIMMPWQGDTNNMIDRFDVRAHLDYIPEVKIPYTPPEDLEQEERQCNYERYRILAQNAFLGIGEDKFLQQLAIEEQFGVTIEEKEAHREKLHDKKGSGAAIGYNYSDPGAQPSSCNGPEINKKVELNDSDDDSDLDIIDVDLSIDVNKMEPLQAHELNAVGPQFGMAGCDLFSFLTGDADDAEHQKQLLREEKEKAMFSGRKSRRERRAHRDKQLASRVVSPPSYAAPRSPTRPASPEPSPEPEAEPDAGGDIEFITSFGGDEDEARKPPPPKPLYADKLKHNLKKTELYSDVARKVKPGCSKRPEKVNKPMGPHRPDSRSNSRSRSPSRLRSLSSKSQSRSSKSRSRSSRSRSRSRSYSPRSRTYNYRRSRSPENHTSGYSKRNDTRSMSYESTENSNQNPSVPRYYGRRKEDKSSSELSLDSDSTDSDDGKNKNAVGKSNSNQNQLRLTGSSSKGSSRETLTLKEKLKRKMQAQLTKQLKLDKMVEAERLERESRRQARRDQEMRHLAIKLRRKQREMRHQQSRRSSEDDSDKSHSRSSSKDSREAIEQKKERKSRSKSRSPPVIPVWQTNDEPSTSYRPKPETSSYQNASNRRRYDIPNLDDRKHDVPERDDRKYYVPDRDDRKHNVPERDDRKYILPERDGRKYDTSSRDDRKYDAHDRDDRKHEYPNRDERRYDFPNRDDRKYYVSEREERKYYTPERDDRKYNTTSRDDRNHDERPQGYQNRYERFPSKEYRSYDKPEYDNRWDNDYRGQSRGGPPTRRPFHSRGEFRGNYRPHQGPYQSDYNPQPNQVDGGTSPDRTKNKIKLVDY